MQGKNFTFRQHDYNYNFFYESLKLSFFLTFFMKKQCLSNAFDPSFLESLSNKLKNLVDLRVLKLKVIKGELIILINLEMADSYPLHTAIFDTNIPSICIQKGINSMIRTILKLHYFLKIFICFTCMGDRKLAYHMQECRLQI